MRDRCRGALRPGRAAAWAGAIALLLVVAGELRACDMPVWQYSLENWQRAPYHAYYLYAGAEDPADGEVNQYLSGLADGGEVNLAYRSMDTADPTADANRHEARLLARHKAGALPTHVVLTPRGGELLAARLDLRTAKAVVDSPRRRWLAEQLSEGKEGLLLLLLSGDQAENSAARDVVAQVVSEAAEEGRRLGSCELVRDDPKEVWVIRQLLALEEDLDDLDNAMVFGVFGRGHAMEPYLGGGIAAENIAGLVAFMHGPCTCDILTSGMGMDLLTQWNWEDLFGEGRGADDIIDTGGFVTFDAE